jgi:hypothetical protein
MIDTTGAFIQSASEPAPHGGFKQVLNEMLVETGELTREQFDRIGEVQARTAVLATLFEHGTDDQKATILSKFEGRNRDGSMTGEPDLNGSMFGLTHDNAVQELDEAINALGLENKDELIAQSLQGVHAQKGVHPNAASAVVITKALYFADYDRADKQAIFDAALIMQLSMRSLDRVESFLAGDYNRQAALELLQTSNKLNYKFDNPAAIDVNEALLALCTSEMQASTMLERNDDPENIPVIIDEIRGMHGYAAKRNVARIIDSMESAVALFQDSGKYDLADKATEVFAYYNQRYDGIMNVPHIMMAPDAKTGFEGPDPADQLN